MQALGTEELVTRWERDPKVSASLVAVRRLPARPARWADLPERIDRRLRNGLAERGLERLYTHQREAIDAVAAGADVVVATPTASRKSLCYNLPVFDALLGDPTARA